VVAPVNGALGSGTSGECNLGAIKIAFDFDGVQTGLQLAIDGIVNDSTGCAPLKVDFADTLAVAQSYTWDFGDGSPRVTTTVADVSHTFLNPGTYKVTLIATDNTKCIPTDSTFRFVNVRSDKAVPDFNPVKLLPCENLGFRFDNLTVAPPGRPFSANSFIWDFGDGTPRVVAGGGSVNKTYAAQGTYNVKLILTDPAYCNGPDSITRTVRLAPNVKADFAVNSDTACAPFTAVFKNNSVAGQQFFWDFGDGTTFTGANPPDKIYTSGGTYTVTMVANDPNTCNVTDTIRTVIKVFSNPQASFNYTPFPPVENSLTSFQNTSIGGVAYFWDFGDGDSSTQVNPVHQFRSTGTFNTCLYVINAIGCLDTICLPVQAIVVPALDVPNAFSPNGDGVNDKVFVRGFGIAKMNFRIYNRWGQLIFQSTDQSIGWDGLYKGRQQPLEVYAYVLDVEFSSGERVTKKGDITLLR
jgi:gliding motility-associated-like protein